MTTNKLVIIHESVMESVIKDIFTYGGVGLLLYFNHHVLSGNSFIDVIFILMTFLMLAGKKSKSVHTFYSWNDAKDFVTKGELNEDGRN